MFLLFMQLTAIIIEVKKMNKVIVGTTMALNNEEL